LENKNLSGSKNCIFAMHNDDPRLGTIMETIPWKNNDPISCIKQNPSRVCVALVGFPFDMGVIRNGGVPGAKNGPSTLRMILHKLGTMINPEVDPELDIGKYVRVIDCGDVEIAAGLDDDDDLLERAHAELTKRVELLINANAIPFVVGGGNDQSYANFCGLKNSRSVSSVSVVNVDAHFDVR
jgi:formiminoglutamase